MFPVTTWTRFKNARRIAGTSFGTTEAKIRLCLGCFCASELAHAEVASPVAMSPATRSWPCGLAAAHLTRVLPASIKSK